MQQHASSTKITIEDLVQPISDETPNPIKSGNGVGHNLATLNLQRLSWGIESSLRLIKRDR